MKDSNLIENPNKLIVTCNIYVFTKFWSYIHTNVLLNQINTTHHVLSKTHMHTHSGSKYVDKEIGNRNHPYKHISMKRSETKINQ